MQFNIKEPKDREKFLLEIMYYIMDAGYLEQKKFLHIPEEYISAGGYPLGRIWAELKETYDQNLLAEEEIRFLLKIRMQLTDSPQKDLCIWLGRADEVEAYYKEHGTLSMPNTTLFCDGVSMFQWVHYQKKMYKRGELSSYQIARLEGMGMQWIKPKQVTGWNQGYSYAKQYFETNGHLFVPKKYVTSDGFALGKWIEEQRDRYLGLSQYGISEERIDMLEEIGMFWEDIKNAEWDWFVGLLRECIRKTEKPFVIGRSYRYKNYALGEKVSEVIRQYADGSLTEEQERDLRKVGFKFNKHIK